MLLRKVNNHQRVLTNFVKRIRYYSVPATHSNEIIQKVMYPEIKDLSAMGRRKTKYLDWTKAIEMLPTVEEKIFKVNMPRYYGWRPIMFHETDVKYNTLPCAQYITKTHLVPERGLPPNYNHMIDPGNINQLVSRIKSQIEDVLIFESTERRRDDISLQDKTDEQTLQKIMIKSLMQQIHRIIINNLFEDYVHLVDSETDYEPRLEAYWNVGGIPPSQMQIKSRKILKDEQLINDPIDLHIQYKGEPLVQLRNPLPLREIISLQESEDSALNIPEFKFNPITIGYMTERRHVTNIPGFWPGDPNEFGLLSYHHQSYIRRRPFDDSDEALISQAILASFGWLMGQACYQGFSPYNDITYPLVNQMITTDGQSWSFYVYQMNTTEFGTYALDSNPKRNICWATDSIKLYDKIENGKVHGLNEQVLQNLLKFYINVPEQRDYNMKPYLDENIKVIANYEDDEKRAWLEKHFKHIMSVRPRHRALPEILQWQKIFMIDNKTRPLEKKREPWEFGINPYQRKLDDHHPQYIPKALRPNPKKKYKWEKWEKTFYP